MGVTFGIEHLVYEPILALFFSNWTAIRVRGGYFYNFKLGQAYRAAQTN